MALFAQYSLITPTDITGAVKIDRKNPTCDMQGWYIQKENNTFIFVILKGIHGERQNIPEVRKYYISSGEALFMIDGKEYSAGIGSVVEIPAHSTYDLHSVGDDPVIYFVDVGTKLDLDRISST